MRFSKGYTYSKLAVNTAVGFAPNVAWSVPIFQQIFTSSKSTTETLEKGANMAKVKNEDARTTSVTSFWCLYC